MMERGDREYPLGGWVELDDTYLGGARAQRRQARSERARQDAVRHRRRDPTTKDTRCGRKFTVIGGFRLTKIAAWARHHLSLDQCQ